MKEKRDKLIKECKKYIKSALKIDKIKDAYNYGKKKHEHQLRKSGEYFFIHPIETAIIIAGWKLDYKVVQAALLHDVVEDTESTIKDIESLFGKEVSDMVAIVTKISEVASVNKRKADEMYLKQIFLSLSKSPAASYIKIADRLHNMRTLQYLPLSKQQLISKETLEVYVPLANKIGVFRERTELEDLCFKYLFPEDFERIKQLRESIVKSTSQDLKKLKLELRERLVNEDLEAKLSHRIKTNYSIFKKLTKKQKTISEIHDVNAIRIITKDVSQCYHILGIIHQTYIYVKGSFKDYISIRKKNLYSSLHTCIKYNGHVIEIQIRTEDMEKVANYGIAAYWKYKNSNNYKGMNIMELISTNDSNIENQSIDQIKQDLNYSNIVILDEKGKKYNLNYESRVLDFAFKKDIEKAPRLWKAIINNREAKIYTILQSGDVVELIYKKHAKINHRWISYTNSKTTKYLINKTLNTQNIDKSTKFEKISDIRKMLEKVSDKYISKIKMKRRLTEIGISKELLEELLSDGEITTKEISLTLSKDTEIYKKAIQELKVKVNKKTRTRSEILLPFSQLNTNISIASCCKPIFGEPIIGHYINSSEVQIHSMNCKAINVKEKNLVEANWNRKPPNKIYPITLIIKHQAHSDVLTNTLKILWNYQIDLFSADYDLMDNKIESVTRINIGAPDYETFKRFYRVMEMLAGVIYVQRI